MATCCRPAGTLGRGRHKGSKRRAAPGLSSYAAGDGEHPRGLSSTPWPTDVAPCPSPAAALLLGNDHPPPSNNSIDPVNRVADEDHIRNNVNRDGEKVEEEEGWGAAGLLFVRCQCQSTEGGIRQRCKTLDVGEEGGKDCDDDNKQCQPPHRQGS